MQVRSRQKHKMLDDVAAFMLNKGKILDQREYAKCEDAPLRYPQIISFFGSWNRFMANLKLYAPETWGEIERLQNQPKPVEKPKPAPAKVAPKPEAVKSTVKKEKDEDGKDL